MTYHESKEQLAKLGIPELKEAVQKDAWIALKRYFDGASNGPEAKIACVVVGTIAREEQAKNNARQLTLLERRYMLDNSQLLKQ